MAADFPLKPKQVYKRIFLEKFKNQRHINYTKMAKNYTYTRRELSEQIDDLHEERTNLLDYIRLLEQTLRRYKSKNRGSALNNLMTENLRYERKLAEKDKKIEQLARDLSESENELSKLESKLKDTSETIIYLTKLSKPVGRVN